MNKNLPVEIWDMIYVIRRREFKRRVYNFEKIFYYSVRFKYEVLNFTGIRWKVASWVAFRISNILGSDSYPNE